MSTDTTEKGLEAHIAHYLVSENGYLLRENSAYDNVSCIDTGMLFQFLEATQPKAIAKLKTYHKDLYKRYSDNKEFKEDFSAMMFGMVKEIFNRGINAK
jgi:hypothetical protein